MTLLILSVLALVLLAVLIDGALIIARQYKDGLQ